MSAASATLDALERHRDHFFRRIVSRRVSGARTALRFIDEVGFCTAFTAGRGIPCLREAIVGEREPPVDVHIQHDYGVVMTWRFKDELPARREVYYGKALAGRPSFISCAMLGAFLRLRAAPGGYVRLYRRGMLSTCARLVMDALVKRGESETRVLKLSSGYAEPRRRAEFDRAMRELQEKMFALKVGERADPFSYVWDTMEHRWPDALRESRTLTPARAAAQIARRYFEVAGYGAERAVARTLAIDPRLFEAACARLAREQVVVRGVRVGGIAGAVTILARLAG